MRTGCGLTKTHTIKKKKTKFIPKQNKKKKKGFSFSLYPFNPLSSLVPSFSSPDTYVQEEQKKLRLGFFFSFLFFSFKMRKKNKGDEGREKLIWKEKAKAKPKIKKKKKKKNQGQGVVYARKTHKKRRKRENL